MSMGLSPMVRVLLNESEIAERVRALAAELDARFAGSEDLVLVDEVYDTGLTIAALCETLRADGPRSLSICVLLDKEKATDTLKPDFVGFRIGPEFVIGYGLDHDQRYRHLPYVGVLG